MNILLVLGLLVVLTKVSGVQIITPYPPNVILIEGDSQSIACTARDPSGFPSKVTFVRRNPATYDWNEIPNTERVSITNTTRNDSNGLTRTAVLHINPAIPSDDYKNAPYRCWAYSAAGNQEPAKHGFTLHVIAKKSLPRATVSGATTVYGGSANLTCAITYPGDQLAVTLVSLAWTKNSKTLLNGTTTIDSLVIRDASTSDGGAYTCMALVSLRSQRSVNLVLGVAAFKVKVRFLKGPTEVTGIRSGNVTMECPAEGHPLNITWLRENEDGKQIPLSGNAAIAEHYIATRPCSYCRYQLTIINIQPYDIGRYICKTSGPMGSGQHQFEFSLQDEPGTVTSTSSRPQTSLVLGGALLWLMRML